MAVSTLFENLKDSASIEQFLQLSPGSIGPARTVFDCKVRALANSVLSLRPCSIYSVTHNNCEGVPMKNITVSVDEET